MDDYWGHNINNSYDIWGFVFMILIMTLVVIGVIVLIRYLNHGTGGHQKAETALDILEKRFANGEIDEKEFEEKRKVLSN